MSKILFIFYFLLLKSVFCEGQKAPCGTFIIDVKKSQLLDNKIDSILNLKEKASIRGDAYIAVVVHNLWQKSDEYISDEIILSQIEALNRDFNIQNQDLSKVPDEFKPYIGNVGIHFCLAAKDTLGNPTTGIIRKYTDDSTLVLTEKVFYTSLGGSNAWDTEKYLNIWIVNIGKNIGGLASYPLQTIPSKIGIIIHPKFFGINKNLKYGLGRVATHEVGHFLGLKHTWADDENCGTDDEVSDTPAQLSPYNGCPTYPQKGCSNSEMFMNYMDYVNDPCMIMFTNGQKERMLATLKIVRPSILTERVQCISKVDEENRSDIFIIYPNPAMDILKVKFDIPQGKVTEVIVYNSIGQAVLKDKKLINQIYDIDISAFKSGIYFVKINNFSSRFFKS